MLVKVYKVDRLTFKIDHKDQNYKFFKSGDEMSQLKNGKLKLWLFKSEDEISQLNYRRT